MSEPANDGAPARRLQYGLAAAFAAIGLLVMVVAAPKVPYADSWRFLATFLENPFPANVLAADNGHRELFPNLVRVAELHWCGADQSLQIGAGVLGALATALLLLRTLRDAAPANRAAGTLLAAIGLFWLGNDRKLAHGSEAIHLFLVTTCLVLGLRRLVSVPRDAGPRALLPVALFGLVATLSFGSGIACFLAFAVVLLLQRAPLRQGWPILAAGLVGVLLVLGGGGGATATADIAPFAQADLLLRWLGTPFVWALSPLLDPAHAARLPFGWLREPALAIARPVADAFGPPLAARWPALLFGALGAWALVRASVRAHGARDTAPRERLALGLAWFGAGVGVLVVAVRLGYFGRHPDQLTSQRYVPWQMLFWTGLALAHVLRSGCPPRRAAAIALAAAALFAPSTVWTGRQAWKQLRTAELTAVGAAVGVLDPAFPLVETDPVDLQHAIPLLRAARAAGFAWPETDRLGTVPAAADLVPVAIADVGVQPVANRLGEPGCRVDFTAAAAGPRLLLLDANGTVQGLAVRVPFDAAFHGFARGSLDAAALRAAALR